MQEGTGACGINCLVCGLFRQGKCGPCAPGTHAQAQQKLATQLRLLGGTCPILQFAVERRIAHCSADCDLYPCPRFLAGPYPLSKGYLEMQMRRRGQASPPGESSGQTGPPPGKPPSLH
ncbi:MAG: hypothetical protein HY794_15730 [Desulfarculus sp.]|nr:hypothetical protein [Desulfarculus sp.]